MKDERNRTEPQSGIMKSDFILPCPAHDLKLLSMDLLKARNLLESRE